MFFNKMLCRVILYISTSLYKKIHKKFSKFLNYFFIYIDWCNYAVSE